MGASVVSGSDAPPILDPAEHVLDTISLPIKDFVVVGGVTSLLAWWNTGRNTFVFQFFAEPVGVVTTIRQQFPGFGQAIEQVPGTLIVAGLALGEEKQQGPSQAVGDGVQLGVQATFRSSDTAGKSPFFSRLAAVRWAFRWVASIISLSGWPALPASASKIRLKTPSLLQRINRLYSVLCGPYSFGASFH